MARESFWVYGLAEPLTGESPKFRYVGSTVDLRGRYVQHINSTVERVKNTDLAEWLTKLRKRNCVPGFIVLDRTFDYFQKKHLERKWIIALANDGHQLLNRYLANRKRDGMTWKII